MLFDAELPVVVDRRDTAELLMWWAPGGRDARKAGCKQSSGEMQAVAARSGRMGRDEAWRWGCAGARRWGGVRDARGGGEMQAAAPGCKRRGQVKS